MKRIIKNIVCVLCAVTCVTASISVYAKTTEEKISDAKKEAGKQQEKLDDANETVEELENSKAQLEGSLAALNNKLEQLSEEVTGLENELSQKQAAIDKTTQELEEASLIEQEQYESMKKRIKYLYELGGDGTILQMMIEEGDFTQILNKADYYSQITEYDRKALEEYQATKVRIEQAKQTLENDKAYSETLLAEKEAKQVEIQGLVTDTSKEIAKQEQDIEEAMDAALAYEKELEAKMSTVNNLQEQLNIEKAARSSKNSSSASAGSDSDNTQQKSEIQKESYDNASDASDLAVMAAIIYCEAGGEPYQGQLAVGSVIMNRINSSRFPNTLLGVLYQKSQFSPVMSGRFAVVLAKGLATDSCYQAAQEVLNGRNVVPDCLFFRTVIDGIDGQIIGNQIFY